MRGHRLLLFGERHWWRRRRFLRDYLPIHHRRWRRGHVICGGGFRSQDCFACGIHRNASAHRRGGNFTGVHLDCDSGHWLCAGKSALRNGRHCARYISVRVGDVRDVCRLVDHRRVIDVIDDGGVHGSTAHVDPFHIAAAHGIRWHINFTRTEREPSNIPAEAPSAPRANEDHQSGSVDRALCRGTSHPAPASAGIDPASVVKGRVAPGRVINPGVSPRVDPVPVAFAIRRPTGVNMRKPDVAVVGIVAPVAVVIEIVVADNIVRKILR